ncbi:hypothetical protein [Streptomyces spectabilis]|uniref:Uncharacterized protein n=1 Tax=Streptomyces spectabilis TaxID=68270 RepID=A0A7W8B326_STRST|nr:hypothetical protein [Streptomyces spectabilis]MBB5109459.1 hypothetical protein [Streptomyces spectabilis]MCI3907806.1 hypothetical protein [Streptomyces spectabilis]GGV53469.1 hypothetical protein GCM10010245_84420 [Streptomyces spectabilis]
MIRAGRGHLVRRLADLAAAAGKSAKSFSNQKLHKVPGHPEPISSAKARVLLWDGEQVDAFHAGEHVPALPAQDSRDDLLDRNEAAELAGVQPRTWDRYANLPGMRPRPGPVLVAEVEHWRRGEILDWLADRPGPGTSPGRPVGSRETAPRSSIAPRAAQLLEREPGITAAAAANELGVTAGTAQRALAQARADAVRRLLQEDAGLTAEEVHTRLGYPQWAAARALKAVKGGG